VLAPLLYVAAGMLAVAGAAKLRRPVPTARALWEAGLPSSSAIARAVGGVELVVGGAVLIRPVPAAAFALCLAYLSFAAFLAFLIWGRPGSTSCGCMGGQDAPPNTVHLALNLVAATAALLAVWTPVPGLASIVTGLGWAAVPFVVGTAFAGYLAYVVAAELPRAFSAYQGTHGGPDHLGPRERHTRADTVLHAAGIGPGHPSLWPGADAPASET
jgi:methylamine utilization protein MauE